MRSSASTSSCRSPTSWSSLDELERLFAAPLPLARAEDAELGKLPTEELLGERVAQARQLLARGAGSAGAGCSTHLDTPARRRRCRELERLGYDALAAASCARA